MMDDSSTIEKPRHGDTGALDAYRGGSCRSAVRGGLPSRRRSRRLMSWLAVVSLCAFLTTSTGPRLLAQHVDPPNVVLIVSDDQRPDTIAALGNPLIRTPALDRLVRMGTAFDNAICANPICTPSRAEILTGCSGIRNRVFDFGRTIDPQLPTLPEPFADAGYATWYCGKWHNNGQPKDHGYSHTRGLYTGGGGKWAQPQVDYRGHAVTGYTGWIFRDQDGSPLPELGVGLTANISEIIADAAVGVITSSERPFFLHVNFTAPHDPLLIPPGDAYGYSSEQMRLPENFRPTHPFDHGNTNGRDENVVPPPRTEQEVLSDLAAYYSVITHMDAQIGRIIDALDQRDMLEQTIIVFCSDHGLAMGSHGLRGKQNQYDHTIRVPLILVGPGVPENRRSKGHVYLRDLFPTLCELAAVEVPDVDGKSQVPVLNGERDSVHEFTVGYFRDSQRMIRTDHWKLIHYPLIDRLQLFDLQKDPLEQNDLAQNTTYVKVRSDLLKRLDEWLDAQSHNAADGSEPSL